MRALTGIRGGEGGRTANKSRGLFVSAGGELPGAPHFVLSGDLPVADSL